MISAKTKRVALLSGVVLFTICVLVVLSIRIIIQESAILSEQVAAIAVDQSQQVAFSRLQKLEKETREKRELLRSYYLESQSDSIDFLNYIEQLAGERSVALETINPTEVERDDSIFLSVEYVLTGSLSQVESFITLLENIPYTSQLRAVNLTQRSPVLWEADVTIEVSVLTYE